MIPYGTLTTDDFLNATNALLPPGRVFSHDDNSWQTKFFSAFALFFWQLHQDILALFLRESDPTMTQDMLPDWQEAYGITARGTEDQQRMQLVTVIADPGGFTGAHYVALAASLGLAVTPEATGAFTWNCHAATALSSDDRATLEALVTTYNRASCVVTFIYDL